jgi:uncharacterized protein (TIGR03437 family)
MVSAKAGSGYRCAYTSSTTWSLALPPLRFNVPTLAVYCVLLTAPAVQANPAPPIVLHAPSTIRVGQTYEADLSVSPAHDITDASVKFSLPQGLVATVGKTHYRGPIAASGLQMQISFTVLGEPEAPLTAKVYLYDGSGRLVAGHGDTVYFTETATATFATSHERPLPAAQRRRGEGVHMEFARSHDFRFAKPPAVVRHLAGTDEVSDKLTEPTGRAYSFRGHKGDRVWITAQSTDFDPRLILLRSDDRVVAEDDDSLDGVNARIGANGVLELPDDDAYRILVLGSDATDAGTFRVRLQNFTHDEPEVKAATNVAGVPAAGTISLSGTIVYTNVSGSTSPVRFASVIVYSVGSLFNTAIATGSTDVNGNVTFSIPGANQNDTLFFTVYAEDPNRGIAWVRDPLLGLSLTQGAPHLNFALPGNTSNVTFQTWNVAVTGNNASFLVFDAAVEGNLIAKDVLGFSPPAVVLTYPARDRLNLFPTPLDYDAHYVGGEIVLAIDYGTSPDVVRHEYGHFIADVSHFLGPAGGMHTLPYNHKIDPKLAWNEGWATFFSVAGQNAHGQPSKITMVSNNPANFYSYDLENGHNPQWITDSSAGDDNEGSVQFTLWDLYDSNQDFLPVAGVLDTVSLPLKTIFNLATAGTLASINSGPVTLYSVWYLEELYEGLFQQFSFSQSQAAAIQAVFRDQNMRWEVPPQPPVNLAIVSTTSGPQLQWQAGSSNTVGYGVQSRSPSQSSYSALAPTTTPFYALQSPIAGTSYRVYALSLNNARFSAGFVSQPSQEVTYTATPPTLAVSRSSLTFSYTLATADPAQQQVAISNSGSGVLQWSAAADATWLTVSPTTGTAPSTLTVGVRTAGLAAGSYSGTVTVNASGTAAQRIAVSLVIAPAQQAPAISLSTTQVKFSYTVGASSPPPQTVSITNSGGGTLNWTAKTGGSSWLVISPSSGVAPSTLSLSLNPAGLVPGSYTEAVNVLSGSSATAISIGLTVSIKTGPTITPGGMFNGASFAQSVAPGSLMSIFGTNLAPVTTSASSVPLPTSLAGVNVTLNGVPAPLYFVSPTQLNVQVPFEIVPVLANVTVTVNGQSDSEPAQIASVAPGIFTDGRRIVPFPSGSPGDVLILYITGQGAVSPAVPTGAGPAADSTVDQLPRPIQQVSVTIGGVSAPVLFAGIPPGLVGVTQVNFQVPQVPPGDQPVVVTVGNQASRSATFTVVPQSNQ